MRQKIIFLLLIIGITGLAVGLFRLLNDRMPKQGVLRIDARPEVGVFLDNRQLANTPFEIAVDRGEYTLKLVSQSNLNPVASWQGKIKIAPNLLTYVNADLAETEFESAVDVVWLEKAKSKTGEIALTSTPDGAAVSLDGQPKGVTPLVLSEVVAGDRTLSLAVTGFMPRSMKVRITNGYRLMVSVKMAIATKSISASDKFSGLEGDQDSASVSAIPTDSPITLSPTPVGNVFPTQTPKMSPTPTKQPPERPYVLINDTPTGFLRVRFEPTTQATEAARVYPGEMYPYLNTESGWYQIRYEANSKGWISSQYAKLYE